MSKGNIILAIAPLLLTHYLLFIIFPLDIAIGVFIFDRFWTRKTELTYRTTFDSKKEA